MRETIKKRIKKLEELPRAKDPLELPPSLQAKMDEALERGDTRECARLLVSWVESKTWKETPPQVRRSLEILHGVRIHHE